MFILTGKTELAHTIKDVMIYTLSDGFVLGCLRLWRDHLDFSGGGYSLNVSYKEISDLKMSDDSKLTDDQIFPSTVFEINDENSDDHESYALYHKSSKTARHIYNVLNSLMDLMDQKKIAESEGTFSLGDTDSECESTPSVNS
ncbi:hypothetical protein RF11_08811 [Thelohanellus kitauei]|uniref:Uncharacterized protein n=1 Tax=Thelohanellus kitauei TaxID=669202 RepID=A0A0C2MAI4_THEKT|nr:hypothetical protein RF11_08811 [Thelohanellus kitauei]